MRVTKEKLFDLITNKLQKAGLKKEHADITSEILVHADYRGVHSHGAMRVEYYSERIAKGGINTNPEFKFTKTGPCSAVFEGDNGIGFVACKLAMEEAIKMAKENGIAVVGVKSISHSGALSYYVKQAAEENLIGLSVCQSDPMVVPYGGSKPYYGTNPIAFAAKGKDGRILMIDLATTVASWGKILHARSKNEAIPEDWAVDSEGNPTNDPFKVNALVHIAGAKGYALAMLVDILSGVLLGLPYGDKVTSMYEDLTEYRNLGQLHIVIDPKYFTDLDLFQENITNTMNDINNMEPAPGFSDVRYPGQSSTLREAAYAKDGIEIVDDIYNYLVSDVVHNNNYDNKDAFAK